MSWIVLFGLGIPAIVLGLPFIAEAFRSSMGRKRQNRAPGRIADLAQGATHYRWMGPEHGPVVVCIHGLSTPSYIFAATERSLAKLGYRVLSYDLYGRGYSARPGGAQTIPFFLNQLRALLIHQNVGGPITVMGFSMGGQIAAAFAAQEGPRVSALIVVASSGLTPARLTPPSTVWNAPVIGYWLTCVAGGWKLRRELVENRSIATAIPDLEDRQAAETRTRGFLPALLSSRRHVLSQHAAPDHKTIHELGTPLLAIWGGDDPVTPMASMGVLAATNPDAHHAEISNASHNLLQTHPAQISEALRKFLQPDDAD